MQENKRHKDPFFTPYLTSIEGIDLPKRFTFPFSYEAHPLAQKAAFQLQGHLKNQSNWEHNFGLITDQPGDVIGKMFGVLVVQDLLGEIGYLAAFSGKLANANHHPGFVPPIFDMLKEDGFFAKSTKVLNQLNTEVESLENDEFYLKAQATFAQKEREILMEIEQRKIALKAAKKARKALRKSSEVTMTEEEYSTLKEGHKSESLMQRYFYQQFEKTALERLKVEKETVLKYEAAINDRKEERKQRSKRIQQELFDQYHFLNALGERRSVIDIFKGTALKVPPAGAGECAAPKLLQYAFEHKLKPLAMAEFWWGESPPSEVRQHGQFYPSCNSKCKPILGHMLQGMEVDPNPLLLNPADGKVLDVLYEDEWMMVINKPSEFLSVPGKNIEDSVYTRMKNRPEVFTGPIIVHRLDMSTSGIMLLAKNKEIHKILQAQFIERTVSKRYEAILDGVLNEDEGYVELPLRVDLDDRPRQLVCYEHGKPARTKFINKGVKEGRTRVHFFPITGRTHQLRVHSAHQSGIGIPIFGDDLYGKKADRLYLHAAQIKCKHPVSGEGIQFSVRADFW